MMHEVAQIIIDDVLAFHEDMENSDIPTERGLPTMDFWLLP